MELAFAGVHQLCAPMLDRLDALPAPQREALRVALGLATGNPPDRFLISLATLSLLSAVAEERPLLCLVDDAQWLDGASAQILTFVARRLLAESIAIVFAVREPAAARHLEGLPQLPVHGLDEGAAHALLSRAIPGPDRRSRPRPDRRRGARQSTRAAGAATRDERRGPRGRLRGSGRGGPPRASGEPLPGADRSAAGSDAAVAAAGGGRPRRRRGARLACGPPPRDRSRRAPARGGRGAADGRGAGPVPPSAGALGRLSSGVGGGPASGPPGARRRNRCAQ